MDDDNLFYGDADERVWELKKAVKKSPYLRHVVLGVSWREIDNVDANTLVAMLINYLFELRDSVSDAEKEFDCD